MLFRSLTRHFPDVDAFFIFFTVTVFFDVTVAVPVLSTTTIWNERAPSLEPSTLIDAAAAAGTLTTRTPSR